jgi:PAS domain S-box-containing protein
VLYALKQNSGAWLETLILITLNAAIAGELIHGVIAGRARAEEASRASEERYRLLFERSLTGVYRATLDGYILECNDAFARVCGYPSCEDMLVRRLGDLYDDPTEYQAFLERLRGQTTIANHEVCLRRLDGNPVWVLENVSLVKASQGTTVIDGTVLDITERKQAEQQVRLQAAVLTSAANAIAIADRAGRITWVNPAFTRLTGYASGEVLGADIRLILSGEEPGAAQQALWDAIQAGQVWQGELANRRRDGSVYTAEQTITPVRNEQGAITHFISIKQDIDERKQHEQRLDYLARHDTLTGLLNRHALEQALERAVLRAHCGVEGTLLFLDLDSFKLVNNTLGHAAGDQLLISLGQLLGQHLREGDLLARIGGDNFAVLLDGAGLCEARPIAERLRETIQDFLF